MKQKQVFTHILKTPSEEDFNFLFSKDEEYGQQVYENLQKIINEKKEAKGTYKGVLYDLIDSLEPACTTQDQHDKEIYNRIKEYIINKMREVE